MINDSYYGIDQAIVEKTKWFDQRLCKLAENGRLTHTANSLRGYLLNHISAASDWLKLAERDNDDECRVLSDRQIKLLVEHDFPLIVKFLNENEV